jgi:hypothetical protein
MPKEYKPRSGRDRRKQDAGPPAGWKERRNSPERRLPEVEEISVEEFKRLLAGNQPTNPTASDTPDEETEFGWEKLRKL